MWTWSCSARGQIKTKTILGTQLLQNTWIIKKTVVLLGKNEEDMDLSHIDLAVSSSGDKNNPDSSSILIHRLKIDECSSW